MRSRLRHAVTVTKPVSVTSFGYVVTTTVPYDDTGIVTVAVAVTVMLNI